jgi:hypothetical protein
MSKKNDKTTFGTDILNRFAILTGEGRKKIVEDSKKSEKKEAKPKQVKNQNAQNNEFKEYKEHKENKENKKNIKEEVYIEKNPDDKDIDLEENDIDRKISKLSKMDKTEQNKAEDNIQDRDETDGKNNYLNSQWTVWVHRNDCGDWGINSYKNIYLIDSIGSFWEFFNHFHKINKEDNQYFIMRNKIKPIWEDNNNRNGGICSLKMDCYDRNNKTDVGCEIMICLCILIMNETFIKENSEINGISYSVKNRSIYMKLWTREFQNDIKEKLPQNLMTKFNNVVRNNMFKKFDNNISVRYTPIKPEYDDSGAVAE